MAMFVKRAANQFFPLFKEKKPHVCVETNGNTTRKQ